MTTTRYSGKPIAELSDAVLLIADTDVANCITRAFAAPDQQQYNAYFDSLQAMATEIAAEKGRRGI